MLEARPPNSMVSIPNDPLTSQLQRDGAPSAPSTSPELEVNIKQHAMEVLGDISSDEGGIAPQKVAMALNEKVSRLNIEAHDEGATAKPGYEALVLQLQKSLQANEVGLRTGLGQRFSAELKSNANLRAEYLSLKGAGSTQRKAEFRLKWAEMELKGKTEVIKTKADQLRE